MKRILTGILACLLIGLSVDGLIAQDKKYAVTIYGNILMPVGKFGEKIGTSPRLTQRSGFDYGGNVGLATTGYGGGIEVSTLVHGEHLSWIVSGMYLVSPTDDSKIYAEFKHEFGDSLRVSFGNGSWMNIPFLTGFKYDYDLSQSISLYGTLQGGVNITQQASRKAFVDGVAIEQTTFKVMADFGFEAGVGVELFKRVNVGARYLNLGTPRYEGTRKLNISYFPTVPRREMTIDGDARSVSMILFILGYSL